MNLLRKYQVETQKDLNNIKVRDYKQYQYNLLKYFIDLGIKYVSSQNGNYIKQHNIDIIEKLTYCGLYNNEFLEIIINTTQEQIINIDTGEIIDENKKYFELFFPKLIDGQFFVINGTIYCPTMYILDKPITIKKNSVKLYGLFNSLTVFISKNLCTFCGVNIPLDCVYQLFLNTPEDLNIYNEICKLNNLVNKINTDETILNYFNKILAKKNTIQSIRDHFNNLIIDDYTKKLYASCYQMKEEDINIENLLRKSIKMYISNEIPTYIDLDNKRVIFMELLLSPLLKTFGRLAYQSSLGYKINEVKIDKLSIIKNFQRNKDDSSGNGLDNFGLSGNFNYDISNLMSSILLHKVCFKNPGSTNPPSNISHLHPTHKNKICPVTVSNEKPGETLSILPDVNLDYFGQFVS